MLTLCFVLHREREDDRCAIFAPWFPLCSLSPRLQKYREGSNNRVVLASQPAHVMIKPKAWAPKDVRWLDDSAVAVLYRFNWKSLEEVTRPALPSASSAFAPLLLAHKPPTQPRRRLPMAGCVTLAAMCMPPAFVLDSRMPALVVCALVDS